MLCGFVVSGYRQITAPLPSRPPIIPHGIHFAAQQRPCAGRCCIIANYQRRKQTLFCPNTNSAFKDRKVTVMDLRIVLDGEDISLETPEKIATVVQLLDLYHKLKLKGGTAGKLRSVTVPVADTSKVMHRFPNPQTVAELPNESIGTLIVAEQSVSQTTDSTKELTVAQPSEKRIADYAYDILKQSAGGLTTGKLVREMVKVGWTSQSHESKHAGIVGSALNRNKDKFARLPTGGWTIQK